MVSLRHHQKEPACPFCRSGLDWNVCGCYWARMAQASTLSDARLALRSVASHDGVGAQGPTKEPQERTGGLAPLGECVYCDRRRTNAEIEYVCTEGHDLCSTTMPGPECAYCERQARH